MFRRKNSAAPPERFDTMYRKARKKTRKLAAHELVSWADTFTNEVMWNIQVFKKHEQLDDLLEIRYGLTQLSAVVDELLSDYEAKYAIIEK